MKKILVVYYSRHGHTRLVGKKIAKFLNADIEEIIDLRSRKNIISWAESAFDENLRKPTKIKKPKKDPSDYDLVIVGSPIWDGLTPPVRAYLSKNKFKKTAFFSTFGASAEDVFKIMGKISKTKPIAVLGIQDREIILRQDDNLIRAFCNKIKKNKK